MKEILQSIIPVITAFLGAFLTYLAQSKLINKQLTLNKEQIKFTKSRDSLEKLKSLHLSIMIILTDLDIETKSFEKDEIDLKTYESRCNYARETLTGIISEAFKLYTQQLDFEIDGLLDFYLEIDTFITRSLFKKPYTSTENDNIFPTYYSYDFSMKTADKLLSKIEKTAEIIND
jgi:hypothetical protein